MPYCQGLFLPFLLRPKLSATRGRFDFLLEINFYNVANVGRTAKIFIHQLYEDTGYSREDLLGTMNDRDGWRERVGAGNPVLSTRLNDVDDIGLFFSVQVMNFCVL